MTGPPGSGGDRQLWGFCPGCDRWRLSGAWGDPAACPVCGTPPDPLEQWSGRTGRVLLLLDLPPGTDLPLLG
ncbi:MAG: hypothetical protein J2P34_01805 [Actinobacteria bacterium]|nr:hypothetical protein [Actinomycetota bacterium]